MHKSLLVAIGRANTKKLMMVAVTALAMITTSVTAEEPLKTDYIEGKTYTFTLVLRPESSGAFIGHNLDKIFENLGQRIS